MTVKLHPIFRKALLFLLILSGGGPFFSFTHAQEIPARPSPPRLVNDLAGILSGEQVQSLENQLVAFNDSTSNQIVVLIVNDLGNYEPSQFAYEVGHQWGVGQKEFNNGIVVLVKPKTSASGGEVFIATGYGLEGAIPDAIGKRIVEQEMIPLFRNNDYYGGISAGLQVLKKLAAGEITSNQYANKGSKPGWGSLIPIILIIIFFFLFRNNRNNQQHLGGKIPFWTWLLLMGNMNSGSSGGSWGGGSGGFGGGGGGFGGFGGGGFGGGGAGGSW